MLVAGYELLIQYCGDEAVKMLEQVNSEELSFTWLSHCCYGMLSSLW